MTDAKTYLPPELVKAWELCEKLEDLPWHNHDGIGEAMRCQKCADRQTTWAQLMDESRTALPLALSLVIKMAKEAQEHTESFKAVEDYVADIKRLLHLPQNTVLGISVDSIREKIREEFKSELSTAEATIAELRGLLKAVQDSACTDSDCCPICTQDLIHHASGCVIELIAAKLERGKVSHD